MLCCSHYQWEAWVLQPLFCNRTSLSLRAPEAYSSLGTVPSSTSLPPFCDTWRESTAGAMRTSGWNFCPPFTSSGNQSRQQHQQRAPQRPRSGAWSSCGSFWNKTRIPRDQILVDDYDHASYKETMGFSRFDEITSLNQLRGVELFKMVRPLMQTLGIPKLFEYVRRVPVLAPLGGDLDWRNLPERGLRTGGTIVLGGSNDDVLYRWNDAITGDVPPPSEVYRIAATTGVTNN